MPKRYKKTFAVIMKALLAAGVPRREAEELLELAPDEVARWSAQHGEFRAALAEAPAADRVEAALLKRALGFRQEEASSEELVDRKSGEILEVLKRKVITKEVPPDVRAVLFWLKNRCPERWNERAEEPEHFHYEPPEEESDL